MSENQTPILGKGKKKVYPERNQGVLKFWYFLYCKVSIWQGTIPKANKCDGKSKPNDKRNVHRLDRQTQVWHGETRHIVKGRARRIHWEKWREG